MKQYNLKPVTKQLSFGELNVIVLGERGRGRRETFIPCQSGLNESDYVLLDNTKSGSKKVIKGGNNGNWLAAIRTEGCYTKNTLGAAFVPDAQQGQIDIVATGNGAYGAAGRTGSWDDYLCIIQDGTFIKVKPSGGSDKIPSYWLYFGEDKVHRLAVSELDLFCDVMGIHAPLDQQAENNGLIDLIKI